jgi:hypothetical protein
MDHPLQCRCGTIKGTVSLAGLTKRAICYCKDCQAYAHFLEDAGRVLDRDGGTDVVATLPMNVRFVQGKHALTCMSLSPHGLLRWYSSCCKTAIGNTPRNYETAYVGLVHTCLGNTAAVQQSFGPVQVRVNTKSAKHPVESTPVGTLKTVLGLMKTLVGARLAGSYKETPFFVRETGAPIVQPRVLTKLEREQLSLANGPASMKA